MVGWSQHSNVIGSQECDFSTNRTARSAIRTEIALLWTNQITGNTIDLKMNIIKHYILYIIKAINSSIVSICLWQLSIDNARFPWPCLLTCMSVTILFFYITLLHYITLRNKCCFMRQTMHCLSKELYRNEMYNKTVIYVISRSIKVEIKTSSSRQ